MFRSRAICYNGDQFYTVSLCRGWTAFFIWLLLPHICNWFFSRYPVHNQSLQGMMTTLWRHDDVQHTSWWRHRDVCCTSSWCIGQSGADCTYVIPRVKIRWNHEIILKWVQALWGRFLLSRALFFKRLILLISFGYRPFISVLEFFALLLFGNREFTPDSRCSLPQV